MLSLLARYAWLLGDVALLVWVIYELVSLGPRNKQDHKDSDDHRS